MPCTVSEASLVETDLVHGWLAQTTCYDCSVVQKHLARYVLEPF